MRHVVLILIAAVVVALAVRVRSLEEGGRALHAKEVAARALMECILRAQDERRRNEPGSTAPPDRSTPPFAFLSTLLASPPRSSNPCDHELRQLERVTEATDREVWRAGGYLFEVHLLTHIGHPYKLMPADPSAEPTLGERYEAFAWPESEQDSSLVLYFASTGGKLLQGENGETFGLESTLPESPLKALVEDPQQAEKDWLVLLELPAQK